MPAPPPESLPAIVSPTFMSQPRCGPPTITVRVDPDRVGESEGHIAGGDITRNMAQ